MKAHVLNATMSYSKAAGYLGHVRFSVEGHKQTYELTLQSDGNEYDWNYALNFGDGSGSEEEIQLVDERLETDDELFDLLVNAAKDAYESE